jgi:hypothetical protein
VGTTAVLAVPVEVQLFWYATQSTSPERST